MRKSYRIIISVILLLVVGGGILLYGFTVFSQVKQKDKVNVAISMRDTKTPGNAAILNDILAEFGEHDKRVVWASAENSYKKQIEDIRGLIDKEPEYLIIQVLRSNGYEEVLRTLLPQTKVVYLEGIKEDGEVFYNIGFDPEEEGVLSAKLIAAALGTKGGNILEITGIQGAYVDKWHQSGLRKQLRSNDNIEIAAVLDEGGDRAAVFSKTYQYLLSNIEAIDIIYASTDEEGLGALLALQKLGLEGDIPIVSVGGSADVKKAIMAGYFYGCVESVPFYGTELYAVLYGGEIKQQTIFASKSITIDKVHKMRGY
jgi:ABC-type sugar transport system, periplasmic component